MSDQTSPARQGGRTRLVGRTAIKTAVVILLALYGLVSLFPFLSMVGAAFKTNTEVISDPMPFTSPPRLDAIKDTLQILDIPVLLGNSLVLAVGSCVLILLIYPLAAYAFAVLQFPLKRVFYAVFIGAMFVPGITTLLPVVLLDQELGLIGSPLAVILPFANGAGPLAIVLLRTYYESIPKELHESAIIDGAREFWIYARIHFPLSRSALITVTVLNFVGAWNEYVLPMVTNDDPAQYPLPVGLQSLLSENVVQWNQVMAASLIIVVPIIILFVILQRFFISGLQGSVKG